jgi:hypothetical protein
MVIGGPGFTDVELANPVDTFAGARGEERARSLASSATQFERVSSSDASHFSRWEGALKISRRARQGWTAQAFRIELTPTYEIQFRE